MTIDDYPSILPGGSTADWELLDGQLLRILVEERILDRKLVKRRDQEWFRVILRDQLPQFPDFVQRAAAHNVHASIAALARYALKLKSDHNHNVWRREIRTRKLQPDVTAEPAARSPSQIPFPAPNEGPPCAQYHHHRPANDLRGGILVSIGCLWAIYMGFCRATAPEDYDSPLKPCEPRSPELDAPGPAALRHLLNPLP
ncbi:hypothetical protein ASPACDRAFT_39063 [Aspergillus aculeatus ATCC 16872]|uniref:Uncharacterized protein n=1 Tax=Aspergillus aculeatus (strain ATCC 16872 / CBS 172.66 / WB 5094) TaxID=690307 RepID=A0A1L9X4S5_ASPA1|nr:uncharacterized protein ASPACDRAFT_39063 [Aspergillus aculeatus ATCC 16872]OJK03443.1 hypothetical protein ASPACDRAFT_39063 [Aspergillus aculeatus ATCC 16872]